MITYFHVYAGCFNSGYLALFFIPLLPAAWPYAQGGLFVLA